MKRPELPNEYYRLEREVTSRINEANKIHRQLMLMSEERLPEYRRTPPEELQKREKELRSEAEEINRRTIPFIDKHKEETRAYQEYQDEQKNLEKSRAETTQQEPIDFSFPSSIQDEMEVNSQRFEHEERMMAMRLEEKRLELEIAKAQSESMKASTDGLDNLIRDIAGKRA